MVAPCLFVFYDESRTLLYAGVTNSPSMRFMQHAAERDWWPAVRTITLEYHETMGAALEAERSAIRDERPAHNIQHSPTARGETPIRHVRVADDLWQEVTEEAKASGDSRTAIVVSGIKRELAARKAAAKRSR